MFSAVTNPIPACSKAFSLLLCRTDRFGSVNDTRTCMLMSLIQEHARSNNHAFTMSSTQLMHHSKGSILHSEFSSWVQYMATCVGRQNAETLPFTWARSSDHKCLPVLDESHCEFKETYFVTRSIIWPILAMPCIFNIFLSICCCSISNDTRERRRTGRPGQACLSLSRNACFSDLQSAAMYC